MNATTTVGEAARRCAKTLPVFEKYGIDYCCGGGKSLADAARERGLDPSSLLDELEQACQAAVVASTAAETDWSAAPLGELVRHILDVHHAYMKAALPRLRSLVPAVLKAHADRHGETLRRVKDLFNELDAELSSHLMKEEQVLFPFILAAESHDRAGLPLPSAPCGSVRHPIRQMEFEHESAGRALAALREATRDYTLPPDACPSFRALYEELQRMEADLHRHIHLENNILFPRAIAQEQTGGTAS